jgi:putative ATPase
MPEARINLAQATLHLALAPKSNAVITGIDKAMGDVRAGFAGGVPPALRDSHYPGAAKLGAGARYQYPHDAPEGVVAQQYPPDELVGRDYYVPSARGAERSIAEFLPRLRAAVRGTAPAQSTAPPAASPTASPTVPTAQEQVPGTTAEPEAGSN